VLEILSLSSSLMLATVRHQHGQTAGGVARYFAAMARPTFANA
jgi:hypothetical protein